MITPACRGPIAGPRPLRLLAGIRDRSLTSLAQAFLLDLSRLLQAMGTMEVVVLDEREWSLHTIFCTDILSGIDCTDCTALYSVGDAHRCNPSRGPCNCSMLQSPRSRVSAHVLMLQTTVILCTITNRTNINTYSTPYVHTTSSKHTAASEPVA